MFIASMVKDGSGIATQVLRHTSKMKVSLPSKETTDINNGNVDIKLDTKIKGFAKKVKIHDDKNELK